MLVHAGAGRGRASAPWRRSAPWRAPIADMVRPMPYPEIYPPDDGDFHPTAVAHTMFIDTVDRDAAETIDRAPAGLRRADARGAAPGARRRDGPRARRRDRVRAPREPDHGQRRRVLRRARRPGRARGLGRRSSPPRCGRATPARTSTSSATRARRASARPTRARPGTGSPRSRRATTRTTSSGSTRTSRPPSPSRRLPGDADGGSHRVAPPPTERFPLFPRSTAPREIDAEHEREPPAPRRPCTGAPRARPRGSASAGCARGMCGKSRIRSQRHLRWRL